MVGIRDVADRAGVSLSTVSIILNGNAKARRISDETREKVTAAMEELHYVPNNYAKYLRQRENPKYTIALFWSFDFRRVMMTRFLSGLQEGIRLSDIEASTVIYPFTVGELCRHRDELRSGAFNAVVIANADEADIEFLAKEEMPSRIVLYNRELAGFASVNMDNIEIGHIAAEHIYAKGYKKPAIIYGARNFSGANERERAFCDRCRELGASVNEDMFFEAEISVGGGAECVERVLHFFKGCESNIPDCFFCASDAIAIGFTNALTAKGYQVPEDIGIIAIGNCEPQYSRYNNPSITVIDIPMEDMAAAAYKMFHDQRFSQEFKIDRQFFKTKLFPGKSTERIVHIC